jgi:hypothetical protein
MCAAPRLEMKIPQNDRAKMRMKSKGLALCFKGVCPA